VRAGSAIAVVAVLVLGLPPVSGAQAGVPTFVEGLANADAVDVALTPGYQALEQHVDAGGVIAQARVNSFGTSVAFASQPYPSDTVTGQLGSNYPFYVSSSYPAVTEQASDHAGSHLSCASGRTMSQAHASASPQLPGSNLGSNDSTVKVTALPDGSVTAVADTLVTGMTIAGVLTFAEVRSHASITRSASGHVTSSGSMSIGAVTLAGQSVALTDQGIRAGGTMVPLSIDTTATALEQAGLTVDVIKADRHGNVASAPAIQITYEHPVPGVGPVTSSLLVGYASASVSAKGDAGSSTPTVVATDPTLGLPVPQPTSQQGTAQAPLSPGSAPGPSTLAAVPSTAPVPGRPALAQVGLIRPQYSWLSLYVLTVAGALTIGLGAQLFRLMGVRAR
jgi:hypothetical protein